MENRDRIRIERERQGLSQGELGRLVGISQVAVQKIESGKTEKSKMEPDLLKALNLPFEDSPQVLHPIETPALTQDRIPVLGMANGGPDGQFHLNGQTVAYVDRPAALNGVTEAYSLYVQGESMEPRYVHGEMIDINPHKVPRAKDGVVVQVFSDDESQPLGYVKEYRKKTAEKLILWQHNPPKQIEIPIEKVKSIHVIVGIRP